MRRRFLRYAVPLVILAAAGVALTALHRRLFREYNAFNARQQDLAAAASLKSQMIAEEYDDRSRAEISRAAGVTLTPDATDFYFPWADSAWRWHDEATGGEFRLLFTHDRLAAVRNLPTTAAWPHAGLWEAAEWVRIGASLAAQCAWIVLLLAAVGSWSRKRPLAFWMMVSAGVCALTWSPLMGDHAVIYGKLLRPPQAWWGAPMAAVALLLWFLPKGRPRRREAQRCSRCSYDLTGNESGICPECGTPIIELVYRRQAEVIEQMEPDPETEGEPEL